MTPAINLLKKSAIPFHIHEYKHDPQSGAYGLEAIEALQLEPVRVFKTLLVMLDGNARCLGVAIIPAAEKLDLKAVAKAMGAKKAEMADPAQAERMTGYLVGGISPLGQKRLLPTIVDESALRFDSVFVSGGRRGLEIELEPEGLVKLCKAHVASVFR
uniref:Cys-tRNA(Pro)/Cys-tRNA(Cys) deacylase n=1 Tax=uncultured Thiotrichaceae bacterium TaxID=298394 RepID=A0A6S6S276_9GAMM|nr:MAG: Cys-tRNA(Pro) deacylase YbaK [uncultured Thiotrichaceae bacterium]